VAENGEENLYHRALAWKLGISIAVVINLCSGFRARLAVCQKVIGESLNGQQPEV
jgi:hypothetical protein